MKAASPRTFRSTLFRLIFLPSALLILGLVAAGWVVVQQTGLVNQQLNDRLAQGLGAQVGDRLDERVKFLQQMAAILEVTPASEHQAVFRRLASLQGLFAEVYLLDTGAIVRDEWPTDGFQNGNDLSGREVLRRLEAGDKPQWSDSYVSPQTGRPTVSIACAFSGGMLLGDLDLEPLARLVAGLAEGSDTSVSLVDGHGTYLGHPNPELARQRQQDLGYLAHRDQLSPTATSYQQRTNREVELVSVQPLAETGWAVLVARPLSAIYQPLAPALFLILPVLFVFGVGSFFMVLLIDRHLLGALRRLQVQTEGLGKGDFSAAIVRTPYQELNAILDSFEAMRQSIWVREQDLKLGERRYRRMFEDAAVGILHSTYAGDLLDLNQAMAQLLGYGTVDGTKQKLGGRVTPLYVRPEERTAFLRMLQDSTEAKVKVSTEFYHSSGQVLSMNLIIARVFDTQRGEFILETFAEDVTEVRRAEKAIRDMNLVLEAQVAERTGHLQKALSDLENAQAHLVHSEKMALLGRIWAEKAHELNTPLGAIRASNESIAQLLRGVLVDLPELQAELSPALSLLYREFYHAATRHLDVVPSAQKRRLRKDIQSELARLGYVPDDDTLESLAELGIGSPWDQWLPLLTSPQGAKSVRLTWEMVNLEKSCAIIAAASDQAAKAVASLRNFTHESHEPTFERLNVGRCLDSVLTLFQYRFKGGILLSTRFAPEALVWGLEDNLSQVWTNLISNALQSMDDKGSLTVEVAVVQGEVKVSVTDTGGGIAPEIQGRIFEPFFTTKKVGEGTGLGLDICRKIVAEHRGAIHFESQPGHTTFTVVLPVAPAL